MKTFRLNDLFWTIQGEGFNSGRRALFVRLPFCDLKCSWCDTQFNSYREVTEEEFSRVIESESARFAVITGGEPMMNKQIGAVVSFLKSFGFEIACESNGRWPIADGLDFVTVSPKRDDGYKVHSDAIAKADEFKYVIDEGFDWSVLARHNTKDGRIYSLSPEFSRFDQSVAEIVAFVKENPEWKISLQTHKWMKIP